MITHIVFFKLKDIDKKNFMLRIKSELEYLVNSIEELKSMEIGISYIEDDSMPDLALTSTFDNENDLELYKSHPKHLEVVELMKSMVVSRSVVDYKS